MKAKHASLRDVARFINGFAFKPEDWGTEGKPIIRIQNLTNSTRSFNRTLREVPPQFHVRPGDLLVSWSASLGVFEWTQKEVGLLNQHIFRIVPDEDVVCKPYLRYALDAAISRMSRHMHGSTMQHVVRSDFLDESIFLPTLDEQRRIAAILDKADAIRRKRQQAIEISGQLSKNAFVEFFGDPVANPKGWPAKRLGDLLEFLTSGSRGWAQYYSDEGSLFLRIQNVGRDHLNPEEIIRVQAPKNAEAVRTRVKVGDVLLSITADLGRVGVVPNDLAGAYINQHLAIIRVQEKEVVPEYLSSFLASHAGQAQITRLNRQGVKAGLNFDDIRNLKVLLPPKKAQLEYSYLKMKAQEMQRRQSARELQDDQLFSALAKQILR